MAVDVLYSTYQKASLQGQDVPLCVSLEFLSQFFNFKMPASAFQTGLIPPRTVLRIMKPSR